MSFQNNSIWLSNGSGSGANGQTFYETSTRIDRKCPNRWFMDSSESELFHRKKQAIEPFKGISGTAVMERSLWHDGSHFQSESQTPSLFSPKPVRSSNVSSNIIPSVTERSLWHDGSHFQSETQTPSLFNPKPVRSSNVSSNIIPSVTAPVNMENDQGNQFVNDPSICLTMSNAVSLCLNSGPRKEKVNEVRVPENRSPEFLGGTFSCEEKDGVMTTAFQRAGNNMFSSPTYNTAVGNAISVDPAFSIVEKNFASVGNSSNKRDRNFLVTNLNYNEIDNNVLSIGQAFNRGNYNINTLGEQYEKENGNFSSICPTYNRGQENLFTPDHFYSKVSETFVCAGPNEGERQMAFHGHQDSTVASLGALYNKENSSILSLIEHSKKGEETTISFGGFQNNVEERDHSGRLMGSYDVLLNQSSSQSSGALVLIDSTDKLSANAISASSSRADNAPKNKDQKTKKGTSNNFPSNVKNLLSTGILDGVPVKYVSWSREKNLRGVVKGTGYLCSCEDCKLSKTINAYEFERHAGCKTKHPNNHIYFENGKTIYAVVQELKSTPHELLFDVIQTVTGSTVNQKNFNTWKASYQAATRELQRIYGHDDLVAPS